ncbi:hypothetical protein M9458_049633, partial [Cirrhinus mrigala]
WLVFPVRLSLVILHTSSSPESQCPLLPPPSPAYHCPPALSSAVAPPQAPPPAALSPNERASPLPGPQSP